MINASNGQVIASTPISSVEYPLNILTDPAGNPLTPLTDTALRANPVPITGVVTGSFYQATQPVSIASAVPVTGTFFQATQPVSGSVSVTGSVAVTGAFYQATQPISMAAALPAGSNTIGGVLTKPATTGGTTTLKILSAATTNAGVAKASAGQVYGGQFSNSGSTWAFVKFYNKATAPTVGTDTVVDIIAIPPGGARELSRPLGMPFATGISYAITGAYVDADTTAVTAGQVVGSLQYF